MTKIIQTLAFLSVFSGLLHADESSFDAAPVGWQEFDPRAEAGFQTAVFDYSGGQCRIIAPQPTTLDEFNAAGLARAGLFAPTEFTDTAASVDITDWIPTTNRNNDGTFIGVFTRVQTPVTLGGLTGYSASIIDMGENSGPGGVGRVGRLQLILVFMESNYFPLSPELDFPLDPERDYRLVLVSRGDIHTARVFDLADPSTPVAQIVGQDFNLTSGRTGFLILTDRSPLASGMFSIEATFDNFLAWDGSPCPVAIEPASEPGKIVLVSDLYRSMATDLQTSTILADPWDPVVPDAVETAGGQLRLMFNMDPPSRFFRRKSL